ncbi:hypothetical protein [Spirosoma montaniterrae]|uniref:Uncharacterized protein n=1 Tax=Spirosoma montaniterrae TaxID=1178516 RepID=A0A1P9WY72_9BACT|nr:hypothetical protein [Spirosoma montaniterrae]AQG80336.1 hypothetical protein AWR27_14015 [Spirosoma montaniterrae]
MSGKAWYGLLTGLLITGVSGYISPSTGNLRLFQQPAEFLLSSRPVFSKSLRYNIYSFTLTSPDTGKAHVLTVRAYRGQLLLTTFQTRVEGPIVGADVADLDGNRFPEVYAYSQSTGSGSFGRVYAWQFLPERKADIALPNWRLPDDVGYMGHDSLWVEQDILCRRYPVYRSGDVNAEPTGGNTMKRYRLRQAGTGYALVAEP